MSTMVTENKELADYINKNIGYKGYIGYKIYELGTPLSREQISKQFEIQESTVKKTIQDNKELFEVLEKKEGIEFMGLSEKGKRFINDIIKEYEERNKPSMLDQIKQQEETLREKVGCFLASDKKFLRLFSPVEPLSFVKIDFNDIKEYSCSLADKLLEKPKEVISIFLAVIQEKFESEKEVTFINLPESVYKNVGDIKAKDKGKLIVVEGNVILKSKTEPREILSIFECPSCGTIIKIVQDDIKMREPTKCSCGRKGCFTKIEGIDTDEQKLQIEEPYDVVNRDVENINVSLQSYLTSNEYDPYKNIGERIKVIGYVDTEPIYLKNGLSTKKIKFLNAVGIEPSQTSLSNIEITEEDETLIREFSTKKDIALELGKIVFQNIEGYNEIKEAVILQQVGGVKKILPDKNVRGNIHLLLIGDPSTAKSDFLVGAKNISPKCRYVSGQGASKVGLIGTVKFNDFFKSWTIEGGALAKANQGTVMADELDKMGEEDRAGLHTAMEQQIIAIDKANIHATLITETSLLAAANPKHSGWDLQGDIFDQFNLPSSLTGRFDLIFPIKDIADKNKDKQIAHKMLNPNKNPINFEFIKKYIIYSKKIIPVMNDKAKELIENFYSELRTLYSNKRNLITARDINAIIRLSEAYARLRLSESIEEEDIKNSIKLHKYCLGQLGIFIQNGELQ